MTLDNATVVILGGSSGIGLATAQAARAEGARVVVTGRSQQRLDKARAQLGEGATIRQLDATDEAATAALFASLSSVDHVFITAGALALDARLAPDAAALRPAMDTRFWGALYAAKHAAPKMR